MIETQHAVITFHERRKSIRPHDPGREGRHRPGRETVEVQLATQRAIGVIDVQRDAIDPEMIWPYAQIEFPIGRHKLIERVTVIRRVAALAIEHLDERMRR